MSSIFFNSYLAEDRPNLKKGDVILFTDDVNQGSAYNSTRGMFVAKKIGWYMFSVTVGTKNVNANAAVSLLINSNVVAYASTDRAQGSSSVSQGTNQAIVYMRENDIAKVVVAEDNASLPGGCFTTFSGFLLQS